MKCAQERRDTRVEVAGRTHGGVKRWQRSSFGNLDRVRRRNE